MRGAQGQPRFFTSDLSVKEFLLVREAGFECAGLVMGSSIYHVGLQRGSVLREPRAHACSRKRCIKRASSRWRAWKKKPTSSAPTASSAFAFDDQSSRVGRGARRVRRASAPRSTRAKRRAGWKCAERRAVLERSLRPGFLDALEERLPPDLARDGQLRLSRRASVARRLVQDRRHDCEIAEFTQALYDARELAMERLQYEAQLDGARRRRHGNLRAHARRWDSHVLEFLAIGTSVLPIATHEQPPTPELVMTVNE